MNISDLINQTLTKPEILWSAVSALASIVVMLIVIVEVPKLRREVATYKVQGLEYIRELLLSSEFVNARRFILDELKDGSQEYPDHIHDKILLVMWRLEYVSKLIKIGYLDKDLFAFIFSDDLVMLDVAIRNIEHRTNSKMINLEEQLHGGYDLIKFMAAKSWESQRKFGHRIFRRKKRNK